MPARVFIFFLGALPIFGADAIIQDRVQFSQVFEETRNFRIFLPADYASSGKRYPVIYWFHGYSERFNKPVDDPPNRNYDSGSDYGGDTIANFVAAHDVMVVKWDGYNPRFNGDNYKRPYNISPVETNRQFPLYFPELVEFIDANYRTIADRDHRATAGLSMGGFMSFWIAGKYPHLVSSASNFMGSPEFFVGPRDFPAEYNHDDMYGDYEGVRTRLVTGARDFIQFYHRQMNAIWKYARDWHETEDFDFDHGTPGMAKTLQFHMNAFAHPLPKPAVWSHADAYPNFTVWGWEVASDRKQPGFTELSDVSAAGFRSSVREWLPGGAAMPGVKLSIETDKLYPPRKPQTVTIVRLRDGNVRRQMLTAAADGRLNLELDGEEYEVGIGAGAMLALAGCQLDGAAWATAGQPLHARMRIWNKGAAPSRPGTLRWLSPNPGVDLSPMSSELAALAPGQSNEIALTVTVRDVKRAIARIVAVQGDTRLPVEIPLFPPAQPFADFRIVDGQSVRVYQHATEKTELTLGDGNADGKANPGERIAILLPEDDVFRIAELFTNDACMDNTLRAFDDWSDYDHVGASAKYSLPLIKPDCPNGHVIHALARVLLPNKPNHIVRFAAVDIPVQR
ncbi:MAG TPA: alpha/beta hydrolase-fold protein [Bryobacteraceae bacterium]|nr:alpha/beta hydrolase-fold protein [Bryobacteraceae bacterium]